LQAPFLKKTYFFSSNGPQQQIVPITSMGLLQLNRVARKRIKVARQHIKSNCYGQHLDWQLPHCLIALLGKLGPDARAFSGFSLFLALGTKTHPKREIRTKCLV
jgi:hypothetical protein